MSPTASDDIILSRHNKERTNGPADKCLSEDGCIFSLSSFDEYSVSLRYIQYSIQNQHGNNQKELNISGTETLKIKTVLFVRKISLVFVLSDHVSTHWPNASPSKNVSTCFSECGGQGQFHISSCTSVTK